MKCLNCMRYKIVPNPKSFVRCDYDLWMRYDDMGGVLGIIKDYMRHKEWCAINIFPPDNIHHRCTCGYQDIMENIILFLKGSHTDKDETCLIQWKRDNEE